MNLTEVLLLCAVGLPLAAAPAAYAMRRCKASVSDSFVSVVAFGVLLCAGVIFCMAPADVRVDGLFLLGISFQSGGVASVFGLLCAIMFFFSSLANGAYFRGEPRTERYRAFLLLTLSGILGVFYAGDLLTLYVFFETMSLASWVWVAHNETPMARKAADTYLAMAMIGGLTMLYGLFLLQHRFGTLDLRQLQILAGGENSDSLLLPGSCLLVGFGIKAGMFPFHVWLPKAHPAAPAPSSALLSGILTKSGIYGILLLIVCLLWGNYSFTVLLLALGTVTMVLGALLAVFSMDLKRTLACSSLSQIGFILVGAGILAMGRENDLAAAGLMSHAVNHALTKLILFLIAGVLYHNTHTLDLNRLKGAGRHSPALKLCFLVGAVSLAGVPGFGGYVSKTMLHESIVHQMHFQTGFMAEFLSGVEVLFLFSGGLTAAYMAKLFVKIFLEKPHGEFKPFSVDASTLAAIIPAAAALVLMGLLPGQTYEKLAAYMAPSLRCGAVTVSYFIWENLKGALISLTVGVLVYLLVVRGLKTDRKTGDYLPPVTLLDLEDDVYRPGLHGLAFVGALAARLVYSLTELLIRGAEWLLCLHASRRVSPGKDHHFSHYSKQYVRMDPIRQTLQFELMLFGFGVVVVLVYLLIHI